METGLVISALDVVLFLILGIAVYSGKMPVHIVGYDTMSPEERDKLDGKALGRFIGKVIFADAGGIGLLVVNICFAKSNIIFAFCIFLIIINPVIAAVYANKGNRFRK